jgi:hypothetical protein
MDTPKNRRAIRAANARITKHAVSSGRGGYPAIWFRYGVEIGGDPLMRKDGRPRTWATQDAAVKGGLREIAALSA